MDGQYSIDLLQCSAFMQRDMIGFVTLDLVLWVSLGTPMHVPLVFGIVRMHLDDPAGDVTGLRIPAHMIPDLERVVIVGTVTHGEVLRFSAR